MRSEGSMTDNGSHFKPTFSPHMPLTYAWRSIITINSGNMTFQNSRSDPVFPAKRYRNVSEVLPNVLEEGYYNDNAYASVISCHEANALCSPKFNACWSFPVQLYNPLMPLGNWTDMNSTDFDEWGLHWRLMKAALSGSAIARNVRLQTSSYCNFYDCRDMPHDQWKREVRRWLETSLARIQFNILDIARGTGNKGEDFAQLNPKYRGICRMVKFRSNGWLNVNLWGLLSLAGLVYVTFIGSLIVEDGDLWQILGKKRSEG